MRFIIVALAATLLLSGCTTPTGGGPPDLPPVDLAPAAVAPWWEVGEWWLVEIKNATGAVRTSRLVNFMNDSETSHFWLGVEDRDEAMEHALFDVNPLLGRIHHNILSPHEKGMHTSMYQFPINHNETWRSPFFDAEWDFKATYSKGIETPAGLRPGYSIVGIQPNGDRIEYDYTSETNWFSHLVETDADGRVKLELTVKGHGEGSTGKYFFLQGLDFFHGPKVLDTTHDEAFQVGEETTTLALYVDLAATGPFRLDFVDPAGVTQHTVSIIAPQGGAWHQVQEVPSMKGAWTLKFISAHQWKADIRATGINEFLATI